MSLSKTWSVVWDEMVVEEGLTRTWPWWSKHQRRASGSLGVKVPNVMEKGKLMFSPRNHATMKNHISLGVNLYWIKIWSDMKIKCRNWLYGEKYSKSQPLKSQCQSKIKYGNPHKVKRNEVARINLVQAQVEEKYFIFNVEYRLPLYQEGYHMDFQQTQCLT
jgi:hypothetical protein